MKQTTFIAILLTILMLMLVLVATVVFLAQKNQTLDQQVAKQLADQSALKATADQMASDLLVRDAALTSAESTRHALEGQAVDDQQQIQDLADQLQQREQALSQAGSELEDLAVQLFIFSPKEGAVVPPNEPIEIFVAARSEAGVESIRLTVNDDLLADYPGEGQSIATVRTEWTPAQEGQYTLGAVAKNGEGIASQPISVIISAAYASPADRTAALRTQSESIARSLRFPETVEPPIPPVTPEESPVNLHGLLFSGQTSTDQPENFDHLIALKTLDLIPAEADPEPSLADLSAERIVGYYDPDADRLTVYESSDESDAFGLWSHIHAFAHELQKETFQLDETEIGTLDLDARSARRALVEGDANYLQYLYLQAEQLSREDKRAIAQGLIAAKSAALDDAPAYIRDDFAFAYRAGLPFIQFLSGIGEFDALNEAWANPPGSTEQILHPERYLEGDGPIAVQIAPLAEVLTGNWRLIDEDSFGEFHLRQHLQRQDLETEEIDQAATGWGGGRYAVYQDEANSSLILLLRLAWDSATDSNQFAGTYAKYLGQRYGSDGTILADGGLCWEGDDITCFYSIAGETLIIRAPDAETATSVMDAQKNIREQ